MTTKIGWKRKRNKKKRLARLEQKEEEDYWRVSVKEGGNVRRGKV